MHSIMVHKKTSILKYFPIAFFCMIFLSLVWSVIFFYENQYENKKTTRQEKFRKKDPVIYSITQQFDPISKEHLKLRQAATELLDFPISYKHIETIYFRNEPKKEIMIKMRFTGRDIYNTERRSCLRATYSYHGEETSAPSLCDLRA